MHGRGTRRPQSRRSSQQCCAACTQIVQYDDSASARITYDCAAEHCSTFAALFHEYQLDLSAGLPLQQLAKHLRALDSAEAIVTPFTIKGTTIELPPVQALGGGLNTALTVALPDAGLAPLVGGVCVSGQCAVDVQFRLGVVSSGSYRFFVNIEAVP